jgi:hypothetical protein
MEFIWFVVGLGIVGGVVVAAVVFLLPRRRRDTVAAMASERESMEPPTINYSSLKVSGVGGFGLVIVCVAIAIEVPAIRERMLVALALGALVAVGLIYRRHRAPLPSSGAKPGANTTLDIDGPAKAEETVPPVSKIERQALGLHAR